MYYKFTEFLAKSKRNSMHEVEQPALKKWGRSHSGSIYGRSMLSWLLRVLAFMPERLILFSGTLFRTRKTAGWTRSVGAYAIRDRNEEIATVSGCLHMKWTDCKAQFVSSQAVEKVMGSSQELGCQRGFFICLFIVLHFRRIKISSFNHWMKLQCIGIHCPSP